MKSFKSYLVENEHTYKFRLKIAEMLDDERMDALESALEKYEGNRTKAAEELGIGRTNLIAKIRKYNIKVSV